MRAALYVRVSTEEQATEGFSISAQRERLTSYAHSQEWDIFDYYVDDGYSAKDTNRPKLQKLIADAKDKLFDVVLVFKLDRFTRSVKDLYTILDEFEHCRVGFRSAQEQFDTTTPMGRAMMGMLGIFAQWERETIAERVYVGMEQKHLTGKRNGAIAPLGYDLVDGKLVINKDADFVRKLFSMYSNNNGTTKILEQLSAEGTQMNIRTLLYILSNPVYCGKIRWNYRKNGSLTGKEIIVDGDHEPILTDEDFQRVQDIRMTRKKFGKGATSDFPFSGVVICSRCGNPMIGASREYKKSGKYRFYKCSGRSYYGSCDMPIISEKVIDDAVLGLFKYDKKQLRKLIKVPTQPAKDPMSQSEHIERELKQIAKRKQKWQIAYANDAITLEELKFHTGEDKKREDELRKQLNEIPKTQTAQWNRDEIFDVFEKLGDAWPQIEDYQKKKEFIHMIFDQIMINSPVNTVRGRGNHAPIEIVSWKLK